MTSCRRAARRPLDPELFEARKLFAAALGRVDREATRRGPVALALAQGTKIAGAEKRNQLVLVSGRARHDIERKVNAKPCKTELAKLRPVELVLAVVERGRVEGDLADLLAHDLVDPNRLIEDAAQMKELNLERQLLRAPQRLRRIEANVAGLVVRSGPSVAFGSTNAGLV